MFCFKTNFLALSLLVTLTTELLVINIILNYFQNIFLTGAKQFSVMNNSTIVLYESRFSFLLKALTSSVRSHLLYHLTGFPLFLAHCRRSSSWKYNIIIIQLLLLKIWRTLEKCENNRVLLNLQLFCYALVTCFFLNFLDGMLLYSTTAFSS